SQTGGVLSGATGATGVGAAVGVLAVVGVELVVGPLVDPDPPPGLVQGVPSAPSTQRLIAFERIAPGLSARTVNTPGAGKLIVAVPLELVAWSPTVAPETAASLAPSVTV